MTGFDIIGDLATDNDVLKGTVDLARRPIDRIRVDREAARETTELLVGRLRDVLVTSYYLPVHVESHRLLINQSYFDIVRWFPDMRPMVDGDEFRLIAEARTIEGPHVVIGGPVDGVWYHWLVSWCARLLILKQLRRDIFDDPSVRFLIDGAASKPPYIDLVRAMGVNEDRITFVSESADDVLVRDAILVSFPDQRFLYPDLVRDFAATVRQAFDVATVETAKPSMIASWLGRRPASALRGGRRIFTSRQAFPNPKRRIHNFEAAAEVLNRFGFEIVNLAELSARDQVEMFAAAEFVVGVHGSDLADLMFCSPGAQVLVIENQRNVTMGIAASLDVLCQIVSAGYHHMIVEEAIDPDADYASFTDEHNRDVIVPPDALERELRAMGCLPIDER
ncbi:hypothetical protein KOAAANKH_03368 [Brevundimonas sp. NIBR10]|uniref:glycosyltransferase family 61 protein n=1 Tax=Brevundimonas sp. NIBR10 TaxID=3015997 RepID=UPI0022F1C902|nr:glycosyltransferase family 61 protein [Brevundimonas sp. NIBR10]WGM48467.1 hypothetical protein KOAAANKH_03368 [Brevundimonas sp. NIBR10]